MRKIGWLLTVLLLMLGMSENKAVGTSISLTKDQRLQEIERYKEEIELNPNNAVLHYNLGHNYFYVDDIDGAISSLKRAIEIKPDYMEAYYLLGRAYIRKGEDNKGVGVWKKAIKIKPDEKRITKELERFENIQKQIEEYKQTVEHNPDDADAHYKLAKTYFDFWRYWRRAGYRYELEEALAEFKKVIEINPEYVEAQYKMAEVYLRLGEEDKVVEQYEKVIGLRPDYSDAYYSLGKFYKDQKEIEKAVAIWEKAVKNKANDNRIDHALKRFYTLKDKIDKNKQKIKKNPQDSETHFNLANAYFEFWQYYRIENKLNEAIAELEKAIEIRPDYTEAYIKLGYFYAYASALQKDKSAAEKGITAWKKAIEIEPDFPALAEVYMFFGDRYESEGKIDEAIKEYEKAVKLKPHEMAVGIFPSHGYYRAYKIKGQQEEKKWRKIIEKNPDDAVAHFNLAEAYLMQQQLHRARDEYRKAIEINPDYVEAYCALGDTLVNEPVGAMIMFEKALKIRPNDAEIHYKYGTAAIRASKYDQARAEYYKKEAIKAFKKAIKINPNHRGAHYMLGMTYYRAKRYSLARKHLMEAQRLGVLVKQEVMDEIK